MRREGLVLDERLAVICSGPMERHRSMRACCSLPLLFCGSLIAGCISPDHPAVTGETETLTLESELVGDAFEIFVRLPPGYDPDGGIRYPVVFQLDATFPRLDEFNTTAGFASELEEQGRIEPTIVVGLGYPDQPGPVAGRLRDYTLPSVNGDVLEGASGGAPTFYAFLRDELTPWLEDRYPIAGPDGRALFGHSLGGLFSAYALLQHDPAEPFIRGFVVASPSFFYDSGSIYDHLLAFADRVTDPSLLLSLSAGTLEGPEMMVYFDEFAQRLSDQGYEGLHMEVLRYEENHTATVAPSFRDGLKFLFDEGLRGEP